MRNCTPLYTILISSTHETCFDVCRSCLEDKACRLEYIEKDAGHTTPYLDSGWHVREVHVAKSVTRLVEVQVVIPSTGLKRHGIGLTDGLAINHSLAN